ncbi:MAG: hydrogenase accessory protein HypB, partial [Dehalococcoidia bacterium]
MEVKVLQDILSANDGIARRNQNLLDEHGILTINIMSAPGAGKTSLILQTISRLKQKARIAVIEGDVASTIDANKVHEQGVAAVQINTAGGCHLEANMIENALN